MSEPPAKTVRSYRLVFRRRWRIFRIQGWRVPLPGGLELRLLGYWFACLIASLLLAGLPLVGLVYGLLPSSLRLLALPLAAAWLLARVDLDGRSPHRALAGLLAWRLRPRHLAGLRRCPPPGFVLSPLHTVLLGPDLFASRPPSGTLSGPARLTVRYPLAARTRRSLRGRRVTLAPTERPALHRGKTLEVPAGTTIEFERLG